MQVWKLLIMLVLWSVWCVLMSRSQKTAVPKRMESLNKLQKRKWSHHDWCGLYGTIDEVDTDRKTVVLDVDESHWPLELGAIKNSSSCIRRNLSYYTEGATQMPIQPMNINHQRRGKASFLVGNRDDVFSSLAGSKKRPECFMGIMV